MPRYLPWTAACLVACLTTGCAQSVQGDRTLYSFHIAVPVAAAVLGLATLPVGWFLRKKIPWVAVLVPLVGLAVLGLLVPALFGDRVIVDDQHFECRVGLFGSTQHSVRFDDLKRIQWYSEVGSRGRRSYSIDCVKKSGGAERVPLGTLMQEALGDILNRARARGIPSDPIPW